jgi:hypothetical protein
MPDSSCLGSGALINISRVRVAAATPLDYRRQPPKTSPMTTSHHFGSSFRRVRRSFLAATILPAALACQTLAVAGLIEGEGASAVTQDDGSVLSLGSPPSFAGFADVTLNGGATLDATKSILTLTTDVGNQRRSAFTNTKYAVGDGFSASFVYKATGAAGPSGLADGMTFTVQNNAPTALGAGGGGLGYLGIQNSAALELNLYLGAGQPIGTNFSSGTFGIYISSNPVNLASGHPIRVDVVYDDVALTFVETLTDLTTAATYTHTFNVPALSNLIGGDLAYVGFTGGTGGAQSFQTVESFVFNVQPVPEPGSAILLLSGLTALLARRGHRR